MSITESYFRNYYESLYANKEIYLWGANHELINKNLTDRLYRSFGSATYTKAYYDGKLAEGAGHYGSDCSGSFYPLSKADNTARGYYGTCKRKGSISTIPKDRCCMVFNAKFTHIGAYLGNGITIEMRSSKLNCWRENLNKSRWAYWGIPAWLIADEKADTQAIALLQRPADKTVIQNFQSWLNSQGHYNLSVDGSFGPKTHIAMVKEFQKLINCSTGANLNVDGEFGEKTRKACPVFKKGDKGSAVLIIQAMLLFKGYDMSPSVNNNKMLDAEYGNNTIYNILRFQSLTKGLKQDGIAGPSTCYALFR